MLSGGDEAIEVPTRRTEKRDGKFYAKVAAYTLVVMGATAGATYYITRRSTPGCESPEAMCEAANQGQLAVYYGEADYVYNVSQGFLPLTMNQVGTWACATFVCGLANLNGNLGGVFNALNSTTPTVLRYIEDQCNTTGASNESWAQCLVSRLNDVAVSVKETCQYRLFGRHDVFGNLAFNGTQVNAVRAEVQNIRS